MSNQYIVIQPAQLEQLLVLNANTVLIGYDPNTNKLVRIPNTLFSDGATYEEWKPLSEGGSYDTGDIVIWNFRFWQSLIDDNEDNIPTEDANWTEISPPTTGIEKTAEASKVLEAVNRTYFYTGSGTTWTMYAVASNEGKKVTIKNRGTGNLVIQRAGADEIYDSEAKTDVTLYPGMSMTFQTDGDYHVII